MVGPQFFTTPGGERFVIIPTADYEALLEASEHVDALALAFNDMRSAEHAEAIPAGIEHAIRAGTHPIRAWREHRDMTQEQLAERAGLSPSAITRLEKTAPGAGRPATRRAIAAALDAPLWEVGRPVRGR